MILPFKVEIINQSSRMGMLILIDIEVKRFDMLKKASMRYSAIYDFLNADGLNLL